MEKMFLPVVVLELPNGAPADDPTVMDYIASKVTEPGKLVFVLEFSQWNMYITQPDGEAPWLIYADIGQHFYPPDALVGEQDFIVEAPPLPEPKTHMDDILNVIATMGNPNLRKGHM